MVLQDWQCV